MNVFNEEPIQRMRAKQDPWPIKLAMRYGAKTEKQATVIVIIVSVILLIATIIIYKQLYFTTDNTVEISTENLSPKLKEVLEGDDPNKINPDRLLPDERRELERMGIEF